MSREKESRGKRPEVRPGDRRTGGDRRRGDGIESGSESESAPLSSAVTPPKPHIVLKPTQLFEVLSSVIDKLHRGALVIDASGWVHVRNVAASAMAAAGDAFRIVSGRLYLKSPDQQRQLEKFLTSADTQPALALKVARMGQHPPYRLLVSSLPPVDGGNRKLSLFGVFVYQPESGRQIPIIGPPGALPVPRREHGDRLGQPRDCHHHGSLAPKARVQQMRGAVSGGTAAAAVPGAKDLLTRVFQEWYRPCVDNDGSTK
jgi:hypothetical protein